MVGAAQHAGRRIKKEARPGEALAGVRRGLEKMKNAEGSECET